MIHSPPQVVRLAIDFHENLIEVPLPVRIGPHPTGPLSANLGGEHWTKPVPPEAIRFVADVGTALVEQVLNVAQRKRKPNVHHHRKTNDLRAGFEVAKSAAYCHAPTLGNRPAQLKSVFSDKTTAIVRRRKVT